MRRESRYYHRKRLELISLLGDRCALDTCSGQSDELHIDHVDGRDWEPDKLSSHTRIARYWREYKAGVRLRILCKICNGYYKPRKRRRSREKNE